MSEEEITVPATFDYGPLIEYEITWMTGHVERIQAHQVTYPHAGLSLFGDRSVGISENGPPRVQFHGQINGRWRLVISAREEDIRTILECTGGEAVPS